MENFRQGGWPDGKLRGVVSSLFMAYIPRRDSLDSLSSLSNLPREVLRRTEIFRGCSTKHRTCLLTLLRLFSVLTFIINSAILAVTVESHANVMRLLRQFRRIAEIKSQLSFTRLESISKMDFNAAIKEVARLLYCREIPRAPTIHHEIFEAYANEKFGHSRSSRRFYEDVACT